MKCSPVLFEIAVGACDGVLVFNLEWTGIIWVFCFSLQKGEAVFARCLSSLKDERVQASKLLSGPKAKAFSGNKAEFLEDIRKVSSRLFLSAGLIPCWRFGIL